jgi:hypothetical protein
LTTKDQTIQQIEIEKREVIRKYEAIEQVNLLMTERVAAAEAKVEMLEAQNASLNQQVLNLQCG